MLNDLDNDISWFLFADNSGVKSRSITEAIFSLLASFVSVAVVNRRCSFPMKRALHRSDRKRRLLALISPYLLCEAFPPPRGPWAPAPPLADAPPLGTLAPSARPGQGSEVLSPEQAQRSPCHSVAAGAVRAAGGRASRPVERNLRVPGPSPARLHKGSFTPLFRRPFSHSLHTVAVPMTPPRTKQRMQWCQE